MIKIEHLTKKYGDKPAVDDLNLTIEPGRIYGFLGPNGAGKSTTMNIITGYLAATEGKVTIDGYDILKEPVKAKAHIGYLPEIPPLYPDMTVLEYLTFAAELKKIPAASREEAVNEVCISTGITDVALRLIRNLSKGYKQRVGLAQAILGDPDIIILDEPTVGLDPAQIIEIRNLILELGKDHTVILSSHILSEISAVCSYVFIISHGHLVAADETEKLLTRMHGAQEVNITFAVGGEPDDETVSRTLDICNTINGLDHAEYAGSHTDGEMTFRLYADSESDIRAAAFKCAVDHDLTVLEMSSQSRTLEDVFLELTGDDNIIGQENDQAEAGDPEVPDESPDESPDDTAEAESAKGGEE